MTTTKKPDRTPEVIAAYESACQEVIRHNERPERIALGMAEVKLHDLPTNRRKRMSAENLRVMEQATHHMLRDLSRQTGRIDALHPTPECPPDVKPERLSSERIEGYVASQNICNTLPFVERFWSNGIFSGKVDSWSSGSRVGKQMHSTKSGALRYLRNTLESEYGHKLLMIDKAIQEAEQQERAEREGDQQ